MARDPSLKVSELRFLILLSKASIISFPEKRTRLTVG